MKFEVPISMKVDYDELSADLAEPTKVGGRTREAAKAVAKMLHNHFVKVEACALPTLEMIR